MVKVASFLLPLLSILLPVGAIILCSRRLRGRWRVVLPVAIALSAGFQALFAAWLHQIVPFGWTKWMLVISLSTLFTGAVLHLTSKEVPGDRLAKGPFERVWITLLILGAVFCFENLWILGKQGWDTGPGNTPYFRPPFQNDGERHVILVNALLRGTEAPFLPAETLTYQLYWYHWTAVTAGLFDVKTLYPVVQGAIGATSLLFVFLFLWALARLSPAFFVRRSLLLFVPFILLLHADVFNFFLALIYTGSPGVEADWSASQSFFRSFSLKLVSLTAPQHAFFFAFLSTLLGVRHVRGGRRAGSFGTPEYSTIEWLLTFFCVLSSPVMSLFFFPWYSIAEAWRLRNRPRAALVGAGGFSVAVLAIYLLSPSLFGFSLESLFLRPGNPPLEWGASLQNLLLLPIVWANIGGIAGVLALVCLAKCFSDTGFRQKLVGWEAGVFVVGTLFFYFIATGIEIRRHYSMIAAFAGAFFLLRVLPTSKGWRTSREWKVCALGCGGLALGLHGYFLYCYLGKPSHLNPNLAWNDYFEMNKIVREKFPGLPILAAVDKSSLGLDYPIVMEATTSFSATYHTAVHVKLSQEQMKILSAIEYSGEVVPFGARLGYEAILWGPVEDQVWGPRVRDRFVTVKERLATVGSVSLYRLSDSWKEFFAFEAAKGGNYSFGIAQKLLSAGWRGEAVEHFQAALRVDPRLASAHFGIAQAFQQVNKPEWALGSLNATLKVDPSFVEAAFQGGLILRGLGRMREAEQAFRWAIDSRPSFTPAYRELAALLLWHQNFTEAESVIGRAAKSTKDGGEMMSLLSQIKQMKERGKQP